MSPARPWLPRSSAPPEMMPGADPGGDLDEDHVREVRPVAAMLAERHRVDVALQQRRRAEARGQPVGDRVAVPAGHDRRVDRAPGGDLDRPRDADRRAEHVGPRVPGLGQQLVEGALDPARAPRPARRRSAAAPRARPAPRRARSQTASRPCRAPRSAASTTPTRSLKVSAAGPAPAARRAGLGLLDQQRRGEQDADALHDRRAREPGDVHDVGARDGAPFADQLQDTTG